MLLDTDFKDLPFTRINGFTLNNVFSKSFPHNTRICVYYTTFLAILTRITVNSFTRLNVSSYPFAKNFTHLRD